MNNGILEDEIEYCKELISVIENENLEYSKKEKLELISKLSKAVTHGNKRKSGNFEFNKDAEIYVCKAGHMSIKK